MPDSLTVYPQQHKRPYFIITLSVISVLYYRAMLDHSQGKIIAAEQRSGRGHGILSVKEASVKDGQTMQGVCRSVGD